MEKNKRVIIIVSVLIGVIGISLAYFVGKTIFKGTGAMTEGKTATLNGSTLEVKGNINFNDENIYPGHETLSKIEVIATGNNELIAYNLIWNGINSLNTELKYKVYKTKEDREDITLECNKKKKVTNGIQYLNEECETNINELELIKEGTIEHSEEETTTELTDNEYITSSQTGEKVYYYIIIEYPNLTDKEQEEQNEDIGEGFKGKVHAKISDSKADINILSIFIKDEETGEYKKAKTMPKEGYEINTDRSECSNGAKASTNYDDYSVNIKNLTIDGTSCYLYYDKLIKASDTVLANRTIEEGSKDGFTDMDTAEHADENGKSKLYTDSDDLGTTYYFRGKVKDNWVKFGKEGNDDIWWRIIRINGNGSIRMIYAGKGSNAPTDDGYLNNNGTGSQLQKNSYNEYYNDNKYVGYMYGTDKTGSAGSEGTPTATYAQAHANNFDSDIKKILDNWYSTNLKTNYGTYIDPNAGFCNDRQINTTPKQWWRNDTVIGYGKNATAYAPFSRLLDVSGNANAKHTPTFKCTRKEDTFTLPDAKKPDGSDYGNHKLLNNNGTGENSPIGLITIDEAVFAGGYYSRSNNLSDNKQFYLYTGQYYWTMSPYGFDGSDAFVFYVFSSGYLTYTIVYSTSIGVRPVINLKADVLITGSGTIDSPYEIS